MSSAPTRTRADAKRDAQRRTRLMYAAIGLAVVVFAVLLAVLSTREQANAVTVEEFAGRPSITGDALPPALEDPASDPMLGAPVPLVEGSDLTGAAQRIGDGEGPELEMFVASWCPACQQELPEVVSWMDEGGLPVEVELTAVVTGLDSSRPNWPPDAWLTEEGYTGEVLVDDAEGSVAQAYGLTGTPFWVALNDDGEVVARIAGLLDTTQMTALAEAAIAN